MKLQELFEAASKFTIKNAHGKLTANWKSDLEDEEDEGYIPDGYSKKVLELSYIEAKQLGQGDGEALMKEFLASPIAKSAELIFLDPNPSMGLFAKSKDSETEQVKKLQRFYAKFGFKKNPRSDRMWLVQKGKIADKDLPT
jgi:hypothetical protein